MQGTVVRSSHLNGEHCMPYIMYRYISLTNMAYDFSYARIWELANYTNTGGYIRR